VGSSAAPSTDVSLVGRIVIDGCDAPHSRQIERVESCSGRLQMVSIRRNGTWSLEVPARICPHEECWNIFYDLPGTHCGVCWTVVAKGQIGPSGRLESFPASVISGAPAVRVWMWAYADDAKSSIEGVPVPRGAEVGAWQL
jgi:hypothetical protein